MIRMVISLKIFLYARDSHDYNFIKCWSVYHVPNAVLEARTTRMGWEEIFAPTWAWIQMSVVWCNKCCNRQYKEWDRDEKESHQHNWKSRKPFQRRWHSLKSWRKNAFQAEGTACAEAQRSMFSTVYGEWWLTQWYTLWCWGTGPAADFLADCDMSGSDS